MLFTKNDANFKILLWNNLITFISIEWYSIFPPMLNHDYNLKHHICNFGNLSLFVNLYVYLNEKT